MKKISHLSISREISPTPKRPLTTIPILMPVISILPRFNSQRNRPIVHLKPLGVSTLAQFPDPPSTLFIHNFRSQMSNANNSYTSTDAPHTPVVTLAPRQRFHEWIYFPARRNRSKQRRWIIERVRPRIYPSTVRCRCNAVASCAACN